MYFVALSGSTGSWTVKKWNPLQTLLYYKVYVAVFHVFIYLLLMYDWPIYVAGDSFSTRWKTWYISLLFHSIHHFTFRTRSVSLPLCRSIHSHHNKDGLSLDLPLLALFSAANEPVLVARFMCLAAIPQIIVGRKNKPWVAGMEGKRCWNE